MIDFKKGMKIMPGHRMDRLTEDIKREISEILRGIKDPRIVGLVTVTGVTVSNDLSYARIFVSSLGGNASTNVKVLNSAAGFVRRELSSRIKARKTPELKFIADNSIERGFELESLIDDVNGRHGS